MRVVAWICVCLLGCHRRDRPACVPEPPPSSGRQGGNVVVLVLDDVGVDKVGAYGVHPDAPSTPNIDAMATGGLRFRSAYAEPICSPTRAALLTGRRPTHTGVLHNFYAGDHTLDPREVLLPRALVDAPESWSTLLVGKWHLSPLVESEVDAPLRAGFDHFDGILGLPQAAVGPDGRERGYYHWEHAVDRALSYSDTYLVTAQADRAIRAVHELPEPFFLVVAFSGAHAPPEVPPTELWSEASIGDPPGVHDAMVEALDHEVGRVLAAIGDRATVFLLGDNGTPGHFTRPPSLRHRAKDSVYAGGTHVPLIVRGPTVSPGVTDALAHVTDLFPTVLDLAGMDPETLGLALDGASLVPVLSGEDGARTCVITDRMAGPGRKEPYEAAIADASYTLVRPAHGGDELYARDPSAPTDGADLREGGPLADPAARALSELREILRHDDR